MIYKYDSSKVVIARLQRLFNDSSWVGTAVMDLGDAIQEVGYASRREFTNEKCLLQVENHRVEVPCDLEFIERIEYMGCRLPINTQAHRWDAATQFRTSTIQGIDDTDLTTDGHEPPPFNPEQSVKQFNNDYYVYDSPFITTSFESGEIKLFYRKYDCDAEGFLMIPDIAEYRNALMWFVAASLIAQGFDPKNKDINHAYANMMYEKYRKKAISKVKRFSQDQRMEFSRMWNTLNMTHASQIFLETPDGNYGNGY